jgi:hypothetical protein
MELYLYTKKQSTTIRGNNIKCSNSILKLSYIIIALQFKFNK